MKKINLLRLAFLGCFATSILYSIKGFSLTQAKEITQVTSFESQVKSTVAQKETVKNYAYPQTISGQIQPANSVGSTKPFTDGSSPNNTTLAVARPANSISTFNTTIVRRPFRIKLFDYGVTDGDQVRVIFNGRIVRNLVTLTNAGEIIEINSNDLRPGVNQLEIAALNEGSSTPNTLGIEYAADQVVQNQIIGRTVDLRTGTSFATTVGFPQIAICRSRFRFPCTGQIYPESAQHALEALGIPPQPITAPLVSGTTGNVLRPSYPRLLTIDRPSADLRRRSSTRNYVCPSGQDRDEYPQAVFAENLGSAHIKCISASDNRGSGSSIGLQINTYKFTNDPAERPQPRLDNGDTIEFVVLD